MSLSIPSLYPQIATLVGASDTTRRTLLTDFVRRRRAQGLRIAGIIEIAEEAQSGTCGAVSLLDLATGARISISQDLGPGSAACNLDVAGLVVACAATQRAIKAGADLVVLSKFGKVEASGGGLRDAFGAAIEAELPIVTGVNPILRCDWVRFAGDLASVIEPRAEALELWWLNRTRFTAEPEEG